MSTKLKCDDRKNGSKVADGVSDALGTEFKNPYKTSESAIVKTAIANCTKTEDEGRTSVTDDGATVTVKSCAKKDEDILSGTVSIE